MAESRRRERRAGQIAKAPDSLCSASRAGRAADRDRRKGRDGSAHRHRGRGARRAAPARGAAARGLCGAGHDDRCRGRAPLRSPAALEAVPGRGLARGEARALAHGRGAARGRVAPRSEGDRSRSEGPRRHARRRQSDRGRCDRDRDRRRAAPAALRTGTPRSARAPDPRGRAATARCARDDTSGRRDRRGLHRNGGGGELPDEGLRGHRRRAAPGAA